MRGEPDPALDRRQTERLTHVAAEPGSGVDEARPDALVQAAEQEQVGLLQARLQLAPDVQARVLGRPRADRARGHQLGERRGIGGGQDGQRARGRLQKLGEQGRRRLARLPGPEPARGQGLLCQRVGEAEMRPHQRRELDRTCAGKLRKWSGGVLDPAHERRKSGDLLSPLRVASGAPARPFQLDLDAGKAAGKPRPAQAGLFQIAGQPAQLAALHARRGQRVLEGREQGDRVDAAHDQARGQQQKSAGRRLVERRAGGIVDLDAPALEFDPDPAGEMAIGRDQGRRPPRDLERAPHPERQRQRLGRQVRMLLDEELPDRGRGRRRQFLPGADRGARPHDFGQKARAPGVAARNARRCPDPDGGALGRQSVEQLLQAILRMARLDALPARLVEVLVEAGQHDRAPWQAGDHLEERAGRRNAAGRAGGDDPPCGRARAPAFGQSGQQAVAAFRGIERALLGEQVRPGPGEDREQPPALLPVFGEGFGDQAIEGVEGHPLGLELVQERSELAGQAKRMLERPV